MKTTEKRGNAAKAAKVLLLTVATLGIYGAYWAMNSMFTEEDINADETEKNADYTKRAAASAFLTKFYSGR